MSEIQPEIKKLQEKYKNDPQRNNLEMMKLYKENNVICLVDVYRCLFNFLL